MAATAILKIKDMPNRISKYCPILMVFDTHTKKTLKKHAEFKNHKCRNVHSMGLDGKIQVTVALSALNQQI
jgi:hypothetical protein